MRELSSCAPRDLCARLLCAMQRLLGKVKSQVEASDASASTASKSTELSRLESIVGTYKVSEEDKAALLAWRHSTDF